VLETPFSHPQPQVDLGNHSHILLAFIPLQRLFEHGPCEEPAGWRSLPPFVPLAPPSAPAERGGGATILNVDWDVIDRLERTGIIKRFPVEEPNSWHMVKRADISTIETHIIETHIKEE
jgi:hypothetical protein